MEQRGCEALFPIESKPIRVKQKLQSKLILKSRKIRVTTRPMNPITYFLLYYPYHMDRQAIFGDG